MITTEFRPKTFKEVAGQESNKKVLQAIVKDPDKAPRSLIFQGEFGTGKTTCARIFARALNCVQRNGDACGRCENCLKGFDESPFYFEYDAGVIGNAEDIRKLRETFYYGIVGGYKVIVLDECHLASRAAQSALLKVLEEPLSKVFFIFCTTNVGALLPTILSRSQELRFEKVSDADMKNNLKWIISKKKMEVSEDVLDIIVRKAKGHARNAHMLLDRYILQGETEFKESVKNSEDLFLKFFIACQKKDREEACSIIDELMTFPLGEVLDDYQLSILDVTKAMVTDEGISEVKEVAKAYGADWLKIMKLGLSDWVIEGFNSDITFQTVLLALFQLISGGGKAPQQQQSSDRNVRR